MDSVHSKLVDHLPNQNLFSSPFDGLETQYLQHKYYQENFNYVVSINVPKPFYGFTYFVFYLVGSCRVLGRHLVEVNGQAVEVKDCCYDVPLHESLQALLRMDIVHDQVKWMYNLYLIHGTVPFKC